jgi:flagellar basal-body rod modification protein FlgD
MTQIIPQQNSPTNAGTFNGTSSQYAAPVSDQQRFADALAASEVSADPDLAEEVGTSNEEIEDRFLALLIAQMRNQDPLNPLENAEVTTQMAQINSASGIESINTQISQLLARTDAANPVDSADVLGREVLVASDVLVAEDPGNTPIVGGVQIPGLTPDATVEVFGENGNVIRRISLGYQTAGIATFSWDGLTNSGEPVDEGQYKFRVIAGAEEGMETLTPLSVSRVVGITRGENAVNLQLDNGGSVNTGDVFGIYQ